MYKVSALVIAASLSIALPAMAQGNMSPIGPQPTTWQLQAGRLDAMLNGGWFIHSVAGSDGEIIMLFKENKFVRCYLGSGEQANGKPM